MSEGPIRKPWAQEDSCDQSPLPKHGLMNSVCMLHSATPEYGRCIYDHLHTLKLLSFGIYLVMQQIKFRITDFTNPAEIL